MGDNSVGPTAAVFGFEDLEIAIESGIMPFTMNGHFCKDPFEIGVSHLSALYPTGFTGALGIGRDQSAVATTDFPNFEIEFLECNPLIIKGFSFLIKLDPSVYVDLAMGDRIR